ncbi:MAG: tetratricopeptide repeat protein [Elusimicrobia bacterium]|nr:tetratricopeptide repeat protein [Elusimicrobiota bacterium]
MKKGTIFSLLALVAATALLYGLSGVFQAQFSHLDDFPYIVQLGHYDRPLNGQGLREIFGKVSATEMLHSYYRPIFTLIRVVDYRLFGNSPAGYHVTNFLFYALAVAFAFLVLQRLIRVPWAPFLAALLFAWHPLHVEPVAWIMAGGYVISGGLLFLSFHLYLRQRTWGSLLSYAAACLANPPAIVLPALVAGHMWIFPAENRAEAKSRRNTLAGMALLAVGIVFLNYVVFPQRYSEAALDTPTALMTGLGNLFRYAWLTLAPLGLRIPWDGYIFQVRSLLLMAGAVVLPAGVWGIWRLRRRNRIAAFGLFWFFASLLPTVGVWKNTFAMAERYAFVASFGLILAGADLLARLRARAGGKWLVWAVCGFFLVFFGVQTSQRIRAWRDTETLFADTFRKDPGNVLATKILSRYYSQFVMTPEKAVPYLEEAVRSTEAKLSGRTHPNHIAIERYNLAGLKNTYGIVRREMGAFDEAIALQEEAVRLAPPENWEPFRKAEIFFHLGLTRQKKAMYLESQGKKAESTENLERALEDYHKSIEAAPEYSISYQNAGNALFQLGRYQEAVDLLQKGLVLTPNNIEVLALLGFSYMNLEDKENARRFVDLALAKSARRQANPALHEDLRRLRSEMDSPNEIRRSP